MILEKAWDWLTNLSGPRGSVHEVTVYSRQGCGCCDKAMAVLADMGRKYRLNVAIVDIDTDPALIAVHGEHVPVVAIDRKIRFRGQVNPVLLERLLTTHSKSS